MKKTTYIISGTVIGASLLLLLGATSNMLIRLGKLQTDLDANSNGITNANNLVYTNNAPASRLGSRIVKIWYEVPNTLNAIGDSLTLVGAALTAVQPTVSSHFNLIMYTPAVTANTNSVNPNANNVPIYKSGCWHFYCQVTNAASFRAWIGFYDGNLSVLANGETNTAVNVIAFIGSTTNWANWQFATDDGNGTHWTITDTGVALSTSVTNFSICLNGTGSALSSAVGYLNGTSVATNSANFPATNLRPGIGIATLADAAAGVRIWQAEFEQDF